MAYGNYYGSTLPPYQVPYFQPASVNMPTQNEMPTNFQPQQRQTPVQNAAQQPQPSVQTSVLWVNNETEAQNAFVLANNTVLIIQRDMSRLYIKSTDSIGRSTLDAFTIGKCEQTPEVELKKPQEAPEDIDYSKFVTRDEIANMIPNNEDYVTHDELNEILKSTKKTTKKES